MIEKVRGLNLNKTSRFTKLNGCLIRGHAAMSPWHRSGCVLGSRGKCESLWARSLQVLPRPRGALFDTSRPVYRSRQSGWSRGARPLGLGLGFGFLQAVFSYLCSHIMAIAAFSAPRDSDHMHITQRCISCGILDANPLGNILRPWIEHTASCQQIHMSPSECWSALAHKPLP